MPSASLVMSNPCPIRTVTFWAFGATTRNIARPSGYTHGYFAPGTLRADGLHSSAVCPQHNPQPSAAKITAIFMLLLDTAVTVWPAMVALTQIAVKPDPDMLWNERMRLHGPGVMAPVTLFSQRQGT